MSRDTFDDITNDYRHPRSGAIETADEAMGIFHRGQAKRVSYQQRDDVMNHIAACVAHGYLTEEEAATRMEVVDKSKVEGDLIRLVRDLPSEVELAQAKARKRLQRMRKGGGKLGRAYGWVMNTKHGRALFHSAMAMFAVIVAVVPGLFVDSGSQGNVGPVGGSILVVTITAGAVAFLVNLVFCILWYRGSRDTGPRWPGPITPGWAGGR